MSFRASSTFTLPWTAQKIPYSLAEINYLLLHIPVKNITMISKMFPMKEENILKPVIMKWMFGLILKGLEVIR